MSEHVRVAGKNQYDTVATDRRAVGAGLVREAAVAGRGAEKRGRRSSLMILLHFADSAGLEEGGTRHRWPERKGSGPTRNAKLIDRECATNGMRV